MNDYSNRNVLLHRKIYCIGLVLAPILHQYKFPVFTYMEYFALFGILLFLFDKQTIAIKTSYLSYSMVCALLSIIAVVLTVLTVEGFQLNPIHYSLRLFKIMVMVAGIVITAPKIFDVQYGRKIYTYIVLSATLFLLVQYFLYMITDKCMYLLLPNVTLNYNGGINSSEFVNENINKIIRGYYYRPASIFIEPAHFSLYVVPWLALEVLDPILKGGKWLAIIVTAGALLTTSSIGLAGCIIVWGMYGIRYIRELEYDRNKRLLFPFALIALLIFVVLISKDQGILTTIRIKLDSAKNLNQSSSLTLRLLRGAYFYDAIGLLQKIFGVGYGNLSEYYYATGIKLPYDQELLTVSYMSGLFTILNSFGIVGAFLFFRWFFSMFMSGGSARKTLCLVLLFFLLVSDCYDSPFYWLIITFIIAMKYENTMLRNIEAI